MRISKIHNRGVSLRHLKEKEIEQWKLGLVQNLIDNEDGEELDYNVEDSDEEKCYNLEEWEGFDEESQKIQNYTNSVYDDSDSDKEEPYKLQ